MPITMYKEMLFERIAASGRLNPMTEADLNAVERLADQADASLLKPIARNDVGTQFSLFNIQQVPSIKIGKLGAGNYGKIYLHADGLSDSQRPHVYAVKVVHLPSSRPDANAQLRKGVEHEIAVLKGMGDYIRSGERVCKDGTVKLYTVMNFIPGMTLDQFLKQQKKTQGLFTPAQGIALMQKLTAELGRLHAMGYAHGDLHTGNIMVNPTDLNNMTVKLIDFNLSRPKDDFYYMNPPITQLKYPHIPEECCNTNQIYFTPASDVYALGAVFNGIERLFDHLKDANGQTLFTLLRPLAYLMRGPLESRSSLSLSQIMEQLAAIRFEPAAKSDPLPLKSEPPISQYTKEQVILALKQYSIGQHTWRSFLSVDSTFKPKSLFIQEEIVQLQAITLKSAFYNKLCEGLIQYVQRFVLIDLGHYLQQSNLGRGIECFVNAIKACREEMDVDKLMDDVRKSLPKDNEQCLIFIEKLQNQISVSSVGNISEHSAGSWKHK